jgi:endonuclease-3
VQKVEFARMQHRVQSLLKVLRVATHKLPAPMALIIKNEYGNDPYLMLISCLLSLRARDTVTLPVSRILFSHARTPEQMLKIPLPQLEQIIHSLGFYRQKARTLHSVSRELLLRFKGQVPSTEEELISIKGIGRKTANLVLGMVYEVPAICVDTHVHRLANQLGLVTTKTPEQTELALQKIVPQKNWIELGRLLVTWGQQVPRKEQVSRLKKLLASA